VLSDDNNPFADKPQQNNNIIGPSDDPKPKPTPLPIHRIVPRPLASSNLHKNEDKECIIPDIDDSNSTITKDKEPNNKPDNLLLALRRSWRTVKLTTWLQESTEYMNRPMVNYAENDNWIPRTFKEAMERSDLW